METQQNETLAERRINLFTQKAGENAAAYQDFLVLVAQPLLFSTDFLYKLWLNFKGYKEKDPKKQPSYLVVSDFILSGLCQPIGTDLFRMEDEIREHVLSKTTKEIREKVASFIEEYALRNKSNLSKNIFEIHSLFAEGILRPNEMEKKIVEKLKSDKSDNEKANYLSLYFNSPSFDGNGNQKAGISLMTADNTNEENVLKLGYLPKGIEGNLDKEEEEVGQATLSELYAITTMKRGIDIILEELEKQRMEKGITSNPIYKFEVNKKIIFLESELDFLRNKILVLEHIENLRYDEAISLLYSLEKKYNLKISKEEIKNQIYSSESNLESVTNYITSIRPNQLNTSKKELVNYEEEITFLKREIAISTHIPLKYDMQKRIKYLEDRAKYVRDKSLHEEIIIRAEVIDDFNRQYNLHSNKEEAKYYEKQIELAETTRDYINLSLKRIEIINGSYLSYENIKYKAFRNSNDYSLKDLNEVIYFLTNEQTIALGEGEVSFDIKKRLERVNERISEIVKNRIIDNKLNLSNEDLIDIDFLKKIGDIESVEVLDLSNNQISKISPILELPNLKELYLEGNPIENIPKDVYDFDENCLEEVRRYFEDSKLEQITTQTDTDNTKKSLFDELIEKNLTTKQRHLDLSNLLSSEKNKLKQISKLYHLEVLSIRNSQISDISFLSNLKELYSLELLGNHILDTFYLSNLKKLKFLNLSFNKITNASFLADLEKLESLELSANNISDISFLSSLNHLSSLNISGNIISNISMLSNLDELVSLDISSNKISDTYDISELKKLKSLNISGNLVSDTYFLSELRTLSFLDASHNKISNVYFLSELTNIEYLNLAGNQIKVISFLLNLPNLKELYLEGNPIENIPQEIYDFDGNCLEKVREYLELIEIPKRVKFTTKLPKVIGILPPKLPQNYIGRKEHLEAINDYLNKYSCLNIIGKGGIGKTTLTAKYWKEYQDKYDHLIWLSCGKGIIYSIKNNLFPVLSLSAYELKNNDQIIGRIIHVINNLKQPILIVLDDIQQESVDFIKQFVENTKAHLLLTSRENIAINNIQQLEIKEMNKKDSISLFKSFYNENTIEFDEFLNEFVETFNYSPLLIELFSSRLRKFREEGKPLKKFLMDYRANLLLDYLENDNYTEYFEEMDKVEMPFQKKQKYTKLKGQFMFGTTDTDFQNDLKLLTKQLLENTFDRTEKEVEGIKEAMRLTEEKKLVLLKEMTKDHSPVQRLQLVAMLEGIEEKLKECREELKKLKSQSRNTQEEAKQVNQISVFISYNYKDKDLANRIKEDLEENDINVIIDSENMTLEENLKMFTERSIKESDVILALISQNSLISVWGGMENIFALTGEKKSNNNKFIALYEGDSFFSKAFLRESILKVRMKKQEIEDEITESMREKIAIEHLQEEYNRYQKLENNLANIVNRLRNSLCIDISKDNFKIGMQKVVDDIIPSNRQAKAI